MSADVQHLKPDKSTSGTRIWQRYWPRMRALARRLLSRRLRAIDEEDVAAAALASFFRWRTSPQPSNSRLWPLLAQITRLKAANLLRRERRWKRGGGSPHMPIDAARQAGGGWTEVLAGRPADSAEAVQQQVDLQMLLGSLDHELQEIARLRMEGHTQLEISQRIGRSLPTVERRLRLLKRILLKDRQS